MHWYIARRWEAARMPQRAASRSQTPVSNGGGVKIRKPRAVGATNHGTTREMLREMGAPAPAASREPQEWPPFPPQVAEKVCGEIAAPRFPLPEARFRPAGAARARVLLCWLGRLPWLPTSSFSSSAAVAGAKVPFFDLPSGLVDGFG